MSLKHVLNVLLIISIFPSCRGHVVLTYPPARTFSNDGSWASKTNCPVSKGMGPRTSFVAGSVVNVTWKSSYPHRGGFKLEVLDSKDRTLMDLTPIVNGNKYIELLPTTENYEIRIPDNFDCDDCTIRLLRQAAEWDPGLIFTSCADVDFVKPENFIQNCSGKGSFRDSHCTCQKTYTGPQCQFKDECLVDSDCGYHGHCVDIGGISYPRRLCYCDAGWFGIKCDKESDLKSITSDLDGFYNRQDLDDDFRLYWRLLFDSGEIEIVVVSLGTSYVALGWRPANLTAECKNNRFGSDRKPKQLVRSGNETIENVTTTTEPVATSTNPTKSVEKNVTTSKKLPRIRFPTRRPVTTPKTDPTTIPEPISTSFESNSTSTEQISNDDKTTNSIRIITSEKISKSVSESDEILVASDSTDKLMASSAENAFHVTSPDDIGRTTRVLVKSYASSDTKKRKRETETNPASIPLAPTSSLHAMDCVDVIVGSARGDWGRVGDYYSFDQSSPQLDESLGGTDDLTAALAFEKDGTTTIAFRRKLTARERFDHDFNDLPMHVIWARGQKENDYSHEPPVKFDDDVRPFYARDELKYHGTRHQRGTANVHFYNEVRKETKEKSHGEWKRPGDCRGTDCEYCATWEFDPESDDVHFVIFTKNSNSWTGIGFSKDRLMNNTDVIIGWVNEDGRYFMMDMWIEGYSAPLLDDFQNIDNMSGMRNESGTTLKFSRKRETGDENKDLSFGDSQCLYMIFPFRGGHYNPVNKKLKMHEKIPAVSHHQICLRSYESETIETTVETIRSMATKTETTFTTPAMTTVTTMRNSLPSPAYRVQFRIELEEQLQRTLELNSDKILAVLKEKIGDETTSVLQNATDFRRVIVDRLDRDSNSSEWLIATVFIVVDKSNPNENSVQKVVSQRIAEGKIGKLSVDPNFIAFENIETEAIFDPNVDEVKSNSDEQTIAIYAVITAVSALGLLLFVQIVCTIYRTRHVRRTRTSKEQLITNSGWKDYSNSNNYNYEPFLPLDSEPGGSSKKKSPSPAKSDTPESSKPNPRHQLDSGRKSESLSRLTPSSAAGRGAINAYATHDRSGLRENGRAKSPTSRNPRELQPDFYFMPSQRRYTGDVIRVSVDYNNPNYSGK